MLYYTAPRWIYFLDPPRGLLLRNYIHMCKCMCIYIYMTYMYVCMYVCMYVRMYVCMHVCMYVTRLKAIGSLIQGPRKKKLPHVPWLRVVHLKKDFLHITPSKGVLTMAHLSNAENSEKSPLPRSLPPTPP